VVIPPNLVFSTGSGALFCINGFFRQAIGPMG
jgi:hypothetical protein